LNWTVGEEPQPEEEEEFYPEPEHYSAFTLWNKREYGGTLPQREYFDEFVNMYYEIDDVYT
jgi:hypothetical protein